jgi:DHA1 family tetracycline resistance protein-like MFS transporter
MGEHKKLFSITLIVYFLEWFAVGLSFPLFSFFLFDKEFLFVPLETTDAIRGLWLGILFAALSIMQFICAPILGLLSDAKGRRPILLLALGINLFGSLMTNLGVSSENLPLLVLARAVVGIGAGGAAVFLAAISDVSPPTQIASSFGLLNASRSLGYGLGMFLSGNLTKLPFFTFTPFESPFVVASLLNFIGIILVLFVFKETHEIREKFTLKFKELFNNFKKGFRVPQINNLLLIIFIFCFGWSLYWEFMPVTWQKILSLNVSEVGLLYAYGIAINCFASAVLIRPVFKYIRDGKVLFFSIITLGIFILLLMFKLKTTLLWFLIPVEQFLIALVYPAALSMIVSLAKKEQRGLALGSFNSVKALAFAFSPFSGVLMGISFKAPFLVAGSFMFISALLLWTAFRKKIFPQLS